MTLHPYSFEATVELRGDGRYVHACVYLPGALARELTVGRSRLRIRGELDELPFAGAWQPSPAGHFLLLSRATCRAAGIAVGDRIEVRFRLDDPDAVSVPNELERALAANREAARAWNALTPGRRRGLAHLIAAARTPATVARRVDEILAGLCGRAALPGPKSTPVRTAAGAAGSTRAKRAAAPRARRRGTRS